VQAGQRLEQRIGWRRVGDPVAGAGKCAKANLDQVVAAVAHRDLRRVQPEVLGNGRAGRCRIRARIEAQ
jgi:hypothetical protein